MHITARFTFIHLVNCCNTLILKNKNLRSVAISQIIFECCRQRSYTQGLIQKKTTYLMLIKFKTNEKPMFFVIIKHIIWSLQTLNGLKGPYMVPTIISAGSIIPSPVSWTCWVFSIVLFKGSYLPLLSNKEFVESLPCCPDWKLDQKWSLDINFPANCH